MIKLVVGLGNPGTQYEFTRHNIAWLVLDQVSEINSKIWKSKFKGEFTDLEIKDEKRYFLKPHTYMNLSGEAVGELCRFYKIEPHEVLVIQDEVDLDFGVMTFKDGGGLAGHNGLKSIKQHLGTDRFKRMRVGVGKPNRGELASWVLSAFKNDEIKDLEKILIGCVQALDDVLKSDFKRIQTKYNKKNFLKE